VNSTGFLCIFKNTNHLFLISAKMFTALSLINSNTYLLACEMQLPKARQHEKGDTKMKNTISKNAAYIGAGVGLVLFAIFGLLPGSLLGGAAGIKFAGLFFALPLEPGLISRAIVLASMLVGVVVSGISIVTATSSSGWLLGKALEAVHPATSVEAFSIRNK
jgi:hypothetical protein